MDNPWIIHGKSMGNPWGNPWIINGLSMDYPWIIHGLSMDYPWIFQIHKSVKKPRVPLPWTCAQNREKSLDCEKEKETKGALVQPCRFLLMGSHCILCVCDHARRTNVFTKWFYRSFSKSLVSTMKKLCSVYTKRWGIQLIGSELNSFDKFVREYIPSIHVMVFNNIVWLGLPIWYIYFHGNDI